MISVKLESLDNLGATSAKNPREMGNSVKFGKVQSDLITLNYAELIPKMDLFSSLWCLKTRSDLECSSPAFQKHACS